MSILYNSEQVQSLEDKMVRIYKADLEDVLQKMIFYKRTSGYIAHDLSGRLAFFDSEPSFGGVYVTRDEIVGYINDFGKWSRPKKYDTEHKLKRESHKLDRIIEFENYPISILKYGNSDNRERGLHPTQKPISLMEYLILTYSNENDTILDNTFGSCTTGIACINTNRNFIGIEKDEKYFKIAEQRINARTLFS